MRILFVTAPFKSHLYVQVPLAWALRTAGHDVRVAGHPDMVDDIAHTGLPAVPVGEVVPLHEMMAALEPPKSPEPYDPDARRPDQSEYAVDDPHPELVESSGGWRHLFNPDPFIEGMVDLARSWRPDLVVWDSFAFAGGVAARASGAAHARINFGADGVAQLRVAWWNYWRRCGATNVEDPMRDWLGPILHRYGCEFDDELVFGQWTVFPMPNWVYRPAELVYVPMRHVPFNGPLSTPDWLYEKPARKRICVTLGMSHRDRTYGVVASDHDLLEAVADFDVEVVATLNTKQLAAMKHVPDNVRAVEFVPLNALLPTCSAVLHSGGAGTFASAVEHAVPQLIVPNSYWSERWFGPLAMANGIEAYGAGVYVADANQLTAELLRKQLHRVLDDESFVHSALRMRKDILAMPSPNDVVPVLERLTTEHCGTGA